MKTLLTVLAMLIATILLASCDSMPLGGGEAPPQYVPPAVPPPPLPGQQPGQQVPTMPTVPGVPTPGVPIPPVPPVPVPPVAPAAPGSFAWTETPAIDQIPDAPLSGMANGRPFTAASVVFEPGSDEWRMIVRDQPLTEPTAVLTGGQSINIDLSEFPATGANFTRPMEYGDGYWQIGNDPANPESTTSWNADNAWVLQITDWQVTDYDENGSVFQNAGTASGKIAVCYKGGGSIQNSWVAGTFENATVRYMGKPFWLGEGAESSGSSASSKGSSGKKTGSTPPKGGLEGKLPPGIVPPTKEEPKKEEPVQPEPEKTEPKKEEPKGEAGESQTDKLKKKIKKLKKKLKKGKDEGK